MATREIKIDIKYVNDQGGKSRVKGTLSEIDAEVKRINKSTAEDHKRTQKVIAEATKSRVAEELRAEKRAEADKKKIVNGFLADLKRVESESKAVATRTSSAFSSAFKGGLVGGLIGSVSLQLAKLPSMMKSTVDEMVSIAADRQNAFKGLESIAAFKGISSGDAKLAVTNLRLVKAGILEVGDATTGLKNLLATGFSLPQAVQLLERFSDSAAFGKQAALSYGDAIRSATEGIKNQNSVLVDNAGVTKNISVILKEAGFEMEDLSDKTKSHSALLALYNGLLSETQAQVGDADKLTQGYTGSTAALTTATNNLYAAVGKQIIQSPELLALIQTITGEINDQTEALSKNEKQSDNTTKSLVSNFAEIGLEAVIMGRNIQFVFEGVGRTLGMTITALSTASLTALGTIPLLVDGLILFPINKAIDAINSLIDNIPMAMKGMIGMGDAQSPIPNLGYTGVADAISATWAMLKRQYEDFDQFVKRSQEGDKRIRDAYSQNLKKNLQTISSAAVPPGVTVTGWKSFGSPTGTATSGTDTGTHAGGGSSGKPTGSPAGGEPAMRRFFEDELGFHVNRTFGREINKGSLHPKGRAIDVDHTGVPNNELVRRIALAIEKGYQFVDERVKRKGIKQTGAHLHFEKDPNDPSSFLSANYYGGADNLAYLKSIDAKRLGKGGGTAGGLKEDVGKFLRDQSDALTKGEQEKLVRQAVEVYKITGLIPSGDMLRKVRDLMVDEAKAAGTIQPTEADIQSIFAANAARKREGRGAVSTTGTVSTIVQGRSPLLTESQQYIQNLRVSLGLEKDAEGTQTRSYQLLVRKNVIEEEIAARLQAQAQDRADAFVDLEVEYQLMIRRNKAADEQNRILQERNDLQRDINQLEDLIATTGVNSALRYRRAWLEATLDVKEATIRANEEIIRANVRLDDARVTHSEQAKAKILAHLAEQKTQTDLLADAFINAFDAASSGIDKLFDKIKVGKIPVIGDYLKGQAKAGLTQVFRGIVDRVFPGATDKMDEAKDPKLYEAKKHTKLLEAIARNTGGMPVGYGSSSGGGFGSILQGLGGGSGMGPGGTPYFNPNGGGFGGSAVPGGSAGPGGTVAVPPPGNGGLGGFGGMFSGFKKMFGPRKNILTGKMSGLAGVAGGIGDAASMAGGMIGGRWGNLLSMAGTGVSIGANFGPWGALIGGLIGGGAGLIMALMGGDKSIKKLKEAALSEYGITVKDKSVLKSIKQIGEQYFGKGKVAENAVPVIQLDESKNILRNYAEATNQSGTKIDILSHGDENWSGNQFRGRFGGFRSMGGGVRAGYEYMVGERGPERVTFPRDGYVTPNHSLPSVSGPGGNGDQHLKVILGQLENTINELTTRLRAFTPGDVLAMGAKENPAAIRDGYESQLQSDPRATTNSQRLQGVYY